MRESKLERIFNSRVKQAGGLSLKFVSPNMSGVPDRIVLISGCTYFIELKTTSRLSRKQERVHQLFVRAGVKVRIIKTIEQIEEFVNEITRVSEDSG